MRLIEENGTTFNALIHICNTQFIHIYISRYPILNFFFMFFT